MVNKEKKMYQNVEKWRKVSKNKRQDFLRSYTLKQVIGSMAMEGEPVSELWMQQNSR